MKKCDCGRNSVYFQKYDGKYLCERCIARYIEKKLRKELRGKEKKAVLIKKGNSVEDVVLLFLMKKYFRGKLRTTGKADFIFASNSLDQEAESVFAGFVGNKAKERNNVVKPLGEISREKLVIYAKHRGLIFREGKKSIYGSAIDEMEKKYPGVKLQIVRFSDKLKKSRSNLSPNSKSGDSPPKT